MTTSRLLLSALLTAALLTSACAGTHRAPETQGDARLRDSAPEKIAAQRAATPGLEAEDQRWGIVAARERRRRLDEQRTNAAAPLPVRGAGAVDVAPFAPAPTKAP